MMKIPKTILHNPDEALSREWLMTNGIGGYASSSVVGANTRRYHGLLVASYPAPLGRQVLLSKVDEELMVGGRTHSLGTNEYADGTIHPKGFKHIASFRLELGIPTWEYVLPGVKLTKQVWMEQGSNTVYLLYRLIESPGIARLCVRPFCAFRGYHTVGIDGSRFTVDDESGSVTDRASRITLHLSSTGVFKSAPDAYRSFLYRAERERGFDDCIEDLFAPGSFAEDMKAGDTLGLVGTANEDCGMQNTDSSDILVAYDREVERRTAIIGDEQDPFRQFLLLAADQFVTAHSHTPILPYPHTLHAGYPWFTDWGRDTMISMPGILLCTGRHAEAREILLVHADRVQDGLVPNRITDDGSAEYNSADASLWYFEALAGYMRASGDGAIISALFPTLEGIVQHHMEGTRHGIHMCPDGLIHAGEEGSQVTWMDARVDGQPITPRIGKPVEINALWYNALCLMCSWAMHAGKPSAPYEVAAAKCLTSFGQRFWCEDGGHLYDVVDSPDGDDASLRPNQIIAVSLPNSPLDCRRKRALVDAVERALLTPYGLRTLAQDDSRYCGRYCGGPSERDREYHQGTVWPWLLGHFAEAHYRVYRDRRYIRRLLSPFREHLKDAGVGSISEVFDGDPPHRPGGCIAQAWSVGALLRMCQLCSK